MCAMIRRRYWALAVTLIFLLAMPRASAHNRPVHQDIVEFAYEAMLYLQARRLMPVHPPDGADLAQWSRFLQALQATPGKWRDQSSALHRLNVEKLKSPPVHPLAGVTPAPGTPPVAQITCSSEIYGQKVLPDDWWKNKMGAVRYPVSTDFANVADCGVRYDWTPGGIFNDVNSAAIVGAPNADHTGTILGMWASNVDNEFDDTHLWYRPTSAAGLGAIQKIADDAADDALGAILIPFVCAWDCIFNSCNDCDKHAKDIADKANPIDDVAGLIPGIGDESGEDYVGVWHFINMNPGTSNEYDDRQGELWEEAGPNRIVSAEEIVLMAYFDAVGLSLHYDPSHGPKRYQISGADDGLPDTKMRTEAQWQFTTFGHTTFEPVDNLAYYGWRRFRDGVADEGVEKHRVSNIAWPLHAIGDATVPMHVAATSSWGHRPFEDGQQEMWSKLRMERDTPAAQLEMLNRVVHGAFANWVFIEQWRASTGRRDDVPIRELVTRLAQRTYDYSMAKQAQTNQTWPFLPGATAMYFVKATRAPSIFLYTGRSDAASIGRPIIEDGMATSMAFLIAAADLLPPPSQ
jgi:hypothetical protein